MPNVMRRVRPKTMLRIAFARTRCLLKDLAEKSLDQSVLLVCACLLRVGCAGLCRVAATYHVWLMGVKGLA